MQIRIFHIHTKSGGVLNVRVAEEFHALILNFKTGDRGLLLDRVTVLGEILITQLITGFQIERCAVHAQTAPTRIGDLRTGGSGLRSARCAKQLQVFVCNALTG